MKKISFSCVILQVIVFGCMCLLFWSQNLQSKDLRILKNDIMIVREEIKAANAILVDYCDKKHSVHED